ncbi:hypothetical protein D3C76_744210 [compost metagenome]
MPGQLAGTFEHITLGTTEYDQGTCQIVVGQMPYHRQAIGARHLQVANGHIDTPAPLQRPARRLNALGSHHIEDTVGIEHLVQGHQLKGMVFKNQDLERVHRFSPQLQP